MPTRDLTISAGKHNRKLYAMLDAGSRNDYGQAVENWVDDFSFMASLEPLRGQTINLPTAGTIDYVAEYVIETRYTPKLTMNHRLRYGSIPFDSLTDEEFEVMGDAQFATLGTGPARYFVIKDIQDIETAHMKMIITAVELKS